MHMYITYEMFLGIFSHSYSAPKFSNSQTLHNPAARHFLFNVLTRKAAAGGKTQPRRCAPPAEESADLTGKPYIGARRRLMIIMSTPVAR